MVPLIGARRKQGGGNGSFPPALYAAPMPDTTPPASAGASPAMAQWFDLKSRHPDALLFFRMGDFFEMFFADAEAASGALDIVLTHRGEHAGARRRSGATSSA